MNWWFVCEHRLVANEELRRNASDKARNDADAIFRDMGMHQLDMDIDASRGGRGALGRLMGHKEVARRWERTLSQVPAGDTVMLKYPLRNHSLLMGRVLVGLRRRGVRVVLLIHDLEYIRLANEEGRSAASSARVRDEERSMLANADALIVHNPSMAAYLHDTFGLDTGRMIDLGLFDYLMGLDIARAQVTQNPEPQVCVAGNLTQQKAGYLYELPGDVAFELYGMGYQDENAQFNVHYHGSFLPEELPAALQGSFGLVWDGPSAATCEGVFGSYLRYNDPHKTSLYLASGLPVVVWSQSAVADYVTTRGLGISVESLGELGHAIGGISDGSYQTMLEKVDAYGRGLREGRQLKTAVTACQDLLEGAACPGQEGCRG